MVKIVLTVEAEKLPWVPPLAWPLWWAEAIADTTACLPEAGCAQGHACVPMRRWPEGRDFTVAQESLLRLTLDPGGR